MTDLFVSAFGAVLGSGRALRTYTCVRALAELGPVDMIHVDVDGTGPAPEYAAIEGLRLHEVVPSRGLRRATTYLRERARGVPEAWARGCSPELVDAARALASTPGRGRVVLGDLHAATALLPLADRVPLVYNAHNVESDYAHAGHNARAWTRWAVRGFERRLLRRASESWMVSRADLDAAHRLVPEARLRYVPNVVDAGAIRPVAGSPGGETLLMVADYRYAPNLGGVRFLAEEVMPVLWRRRPAARLRLVGRGLETADLPDDPRIERTGFVDDLAEAYAGAACVAVPLLEGGGTPLKFVEALAYGVPVVATPLAARGLESVAGVHHLEGADADAFAAAVGSVLERAAPAIAARARALVEREYSVESLAARIAA